MALATTVSKWGTSLGVRIPASFAKTLDLKAGDEVEIALNGDSIVLTAHSHARTMTDLYRSWDGQPDEIVAEDRQWLDDPSKGNEAW